MTDAADVEGLAQQAIDHYRDLCHTEGVDPDIELAEIRLTDGNLAEWIIARLIGHHSDERPDSHSWASILLVATADIPDPVHALIATSYLPALHDEIIRRGDTPDWALHHLAAQGDNLDSDLAEGIARNPHTAPATLHVLAGHWAWETRVAVTEHRATSPDTLRQLSSDPKFAIRIGVARHPHTPNDVLRRYMAGDDDRLEIAADRNLHDRWTRP